LLRACVPMALHITLPRACSLVSPLLFWRRLPMALFQPSWDHATLPPHAAAHTHHCLPMCCTTDTKRVMGTVPFRFLAPSHAHAAFLRHTHLSPGMHYGAQHTAAAIATSPPLPPLPPAPLHHARRRATTRPPPTRPRAPFSVVLVGARAWYRLQTRFERKKKKKEEKKEHVVEQCA